VDEKLKGADRATCLSSRPRRSNRSSTSRPLRRAGGRCGRNSCCVRTFC